MVDAIAQQEHTHHLYAESFQVSKDKDFLLISGPSKEELKLFAEIGLNGPDHFDLQWDFGHPASSDWNQAVIALLTHKLAELQQEEKWTTAPKSQAYWEETITQKFNCIRTIVSKAKLHLLDDDQSAETNHQVANRLVKEKDASLKKSRRDAHRMSKYKCRICVTKATSGLSEEGSENEDACAWRFLHDIVKMLGTDGMSSEESGEDDMESVFFTSVMPWQRDIARELRLINAKSCSLGSGMPSKGAKAAKHIKSTNVMLRKLVKALPPQLYNPEWLAMNQKMASEETFQWLDLM
ncbi:hypothetical protein J3R82DRAFT_675 [Butyriboletus roseoflavus]|nr:hypothetical protein J3R82DRAFT_675 [Butyriboletus roseoflavus]